jgi:hypothetical protein
MMVRGGRRERRRRERDDRRGESDDSDLSNRSGLRRRRRDGRRVDSNRGGVQENKGRTKTPIYNGTGAFEDYLARFRIISEIKGGLRERMGYICPQI